MEIQGFFHNAWRKKVNFKAFFMVCRAFKRQTGVLFRLRLFRRYAFSCLQKVYINIVVVVNVHITVDKSCIPLQIICLPRKQRAA